MMMIRLRCLTATGLSVSKKYRQIWTILLRENDKTLRDKARNKIDICLFRKELFEGCQKRLVRYNANLKVLFKRTTRTLQYFQVSYTS